MFCISTVSFSQEICDNGIDDDGDGLIDLNDNVDCNCPPVVIPSLIPNPSFELNSCCPTTYSQVTCATGWSQATSATSDYFNCGFNFGAATSAGLSPPPDGTGYLGTIFSNGWQEYVGSCLTSPLLAGQSYTLEMSIASTPIDGNGAVCNGGVVNYPPIDITIFGHPGCPAFPINTGGCPSSVDPAWIVVGTATYTPVPNWGIISITFTPTININAVIIGSPCVLPAGYTGSPCYAYFYYDNLILQQSSLFNNITQTGQWCDNNIQLATGATTGGTYQWYLDGVALVGETGLTLNVSSNSYGSGNYTIVTTSSGTCASISDSVIVPPFPTASYVAASVCDGFPMSFIDSSSFPSGTIINWNWDFGDGNTSSLQNPTHAYTGSGPYNPILIVTSDNNCTDTISVPINIFPVPASGINVGNYALNGSTLGIPNGICEFDNVSFSDNSNITTGSIISWNWNFGDGGTSILQNPTHLYSPSGTFNVQLNIISDSGCVDSTIFPLIISPKPTANFTVINDCVYNSLVVNNLSSVSLGSIAASQWNFGDGNTSASFTPSHTYLNDGFYNVTLITVSDSGCSDTITQVTERYPTPIASFTNINACFGDSNCFTDNSFINPSDTITTYSWDFGDGSPLGSSSNICHLYPSFGNFNVTLTTTSNHNCVDDSILPITVFELPTVNFINTIICENLPPTQFTDLSVGNAGNVVSWAWDFGDGGISTIQNPTHTFATYGTYNTQLIVISDSGCVDSITNPVLVNPKPIADFSFVDDCFYNNLIVNDLSIIPLGSVTGLDWNFGDGNSSSSFTPSHTYATEGMFNITLIATSDSNCTDTITKITERYPKPIANFFSTNVCLNDSSCFVNNSFINPSDTISSYIWNFGDGSPLPTLQNLCHLYTTPGTFNVTLIATSNHNCIDDTTKQVTVYDLPIADFSSTTVCENQPPTQFTDLSQGVSGGITTWSWNFGVGSSANQNPNFTFSGNGIYPVLLAIINDVGCVDTITKDVIVKAQPTANFDADTTNGCVSLFCVNFHDTSSSNATSITSWQWDLGNNISSSQIPSLNCYDIPGDYTVSLIVQNDLGCFDTITKVNYISAYPLPIADFIFDPQSTDIYSPTINFTNTSYDVTTWLWNFGDGISSTSSYSPTHLYADSGNYYVQLDVWNSYGCYDSIVKIIRIDPVSAIFIPNTFTPDQDGKNETFFFVGFGVLEKDFEFYIFNRWGENIYYTQKFEPWDGTYKNELVQEGVYVYRFVMKDVNNKFHTYTGKVNVLK